MPRITVLPLMLAVTGCTGSANENLNRLASGETQLSRSAVAPRDFGEPVTVTGLWVNEFEMQRLIPGARNLQDIRQERSNIQNIWFDTNGETKWDTPPAEGYWPSGVYRITVSGRYARKESTRWWHGFGHMGLSDDLFLADQIQSVEYLGRPEH